MIDATFEKTTEFYNQCLAGKVDFIGIDLDETVLDNLVLTQTCTFERGSFVGASLKNAYLPNCSMMGANFEQADLSHSTLNHNNYELASFKNAKLNHSDLSAGNFCNANFQGADLTAANFSKADLRGAILTQALFVGTIFNDAIYDDTTRFPDDFDPKALGLVTLEPKETPVEAPAEKAESVEKPTPKTKEFIYRGNRVTVEIDEPKPSADDEEIVYKEILYRGQKTLVEVKKSKSHNRKGLTYRGVTQD